MTPWIQIAARFAGAAALAALTTHAAQAWELAGDKALVVHTRDQQRVVIGSVHFEPRGDGVAAFRVQLDSSRFTDHFLSMKEFKCLTGVGEIDCHVPYPYRHPGTVSAGHYAWLEHSLMFLFKLPNEFGAKLWNGLYFKLEAGEQGLVGRPQAIDLNRIASPPADLDRPPFGAAQRDDIAPGARWLTGISIE